MKRKVLSVFLVLTLILVTLVSCSQPPVATPTETPTATETPEPTPELTPAPTETPKPTPMPTPLPDSDGDGFNDWFEENVAGYDSSIPNNRYIILYLGMLRFEEELPLVGYTIRQAEFFEKEGVPAENITLLLQKEATGPNLQRAIEEIATKADKDDIVFISLHAHSGKGNLGGIPYTSIDDWIDEIEARVVIIHIIACESETALPVLEEGPCPRIVLIWYGEFMSALGMIPEYNIEADTKYGNGDGYVSLKEISSWMENDWKWQSPLALQTGKGIPKMLDSSNVASQIYLTD